MGVPLTQQAFLVQFLNIIPFFPVFVRKLLTLCTIKNTKVTQ